MKYSKAHSDYSPDTYMKMVRTDDGDIVFKICGTGEMRIATSGGHYHGQKLAAVLRAANALMAALSMEDEEAQSQKGSFHPPVEDSQQKGRNQMARIILICPECGKDEWKRFGKQDVFMTFECENCGAVCDPEQMSARVEETEVKK